MGVAVGKDSLDALKLPSLPQKSFAELKTPEIRGAKEKGN